uniref:Malate dehydrogenase n=1 Tax=candidate division WOR-3 bacterium TaxID=2052148 RepID=A0A7C3J5M2_UNCW3
MKNLKEKSLKYHSFPTGGKIEIKVKKDCDTKENLSLAYTPGVAYPSLEIEKDKNLSYTYTNRKNLVGVISNGTAVLGLGDIGPYASKPVMEGKSVLFKKFAFIDAFDIEIDEKDPDRFIDIVKSLEPTFGGINLEDVKGPECFYIEEKLIEKMDIPVFHDDQHGTSIIATAGLLNACEIVDKDLKDIKLVVSGAGAAALPVLKMFLKVGVSLKNIFVFDKFGMLHKKRKDLTRYNIIFAKEKEMKMEEAIEGADIFLGLSAKGVLKKEMLKKMAKDPIVFALANPDPEIDYYDAVDTRKDVIIATGRSDYPNQINNVLGFPYIFRGVLDCGAKKISDRMKLEAAKSLASLAKKNVPEYIKKLYKEDLKFSKRYLIPKPFDRRVFVEESYAVLKSAVEEKLNRIDVNPSDYKRYLKRCLKRF